MDPHPIPFSSADLERRRLESTINQDLHSLSLASGSSAASDAHFPPRNSNRHQHAAVETDTSFSSLSTIEYPRAAQVAYPSHPDISFHQSAYPKLVGPHGTPRAASGGRKVSQMSERSFLDASPVSTAGHHVSAVTLAEGVFKRAMGVSKGIHEDESGSEWDPDRSLGRLVGELGKAMKNVCLFLSGFKGCLLTLFRFPLDHLHLFHLHVRLGHHHHTPPSTPIYHSHSIEMTHFHHHLPRGTVPDQVHPPARGLG
jgi:hypothetical protein